MLKSYVVFLCLFIFTLLLGSHTIAANSNEYTGIGKNTVTKVYAETSRDSKVIQSFSRGAILQYRSHSDNWYETTATVNGDQKIGYINRHDVENAVSGSTNYEGTTATRDATAYKQAWTHSKALKTFERGTILSYEDFTSEWYKLSVSVNGQRKTGYMLKTRVNNAAKNPESFTGATGTRDATAYEQAWTHSKALKTFERGTILSYEDFTPDWYKLSVSVNGQRKTGYMLKTRVNNAAKNPESFTGATGTRDATAYEQAWTHSKALKTFERGTILSYEDFTPDWYKLSVSVNGQRKTGYMLKSRVDNAAKNPESFTGATITSDATAYEQAWTHSKALKTFERGTILSYEDFTPDWYKLSVSVNGQEKTGYMLKSRVDNAAKNPESFTGVTKTTDATVYEQAWTLSKPLKTFEPGTIINYEEFNSEWYKITINVGGQERVGYMLKSRTDNIDQNPESYTGIPSGERTIVYAQPRTNSNKLKTYEQGTILNYQSFVSNWYKISIDVNGEKQTGYIQKNDVDTADKNPETFTGVTTTGDTSAFKKPLASSNALKTYDRGTVLNYQSFTSNWYKVTIDANGEKQTGYILKSHVDNADKKPKTYTGVTITSDTTAYEQAWTRSKALKTFDRGSILSYKSFTSEWYKIIVDVNGQQKTGYILKSRVENADENPDTLTGYALENPTKAYSQAWSHSKELKSFQFAEKITYSTFTSEWVKVRVNSNGSTTNAYILKSRIGKSRPQSDEIFRTTSYDYSLDFMVNKQLSVNAQTDKYRNEPGYIHSSLVNLTDSAVISGDGVRLRSEPTTEGGSATVEAKVNSNTAITILDEVNGESVNGSKKWYKIDYKDATLYVHSSLVSLNSSSAKLNTTSHIRAEANTRSHIYDTLSAGTTVGIRNEVSGSTVNGSNKWYEISLGSWRSASYNDVKQYVDPSQQNDYQFLVLSEGAGLTASDLNTILDGKGILDGTGSSFVKARNEAQINEIYLLSHALLETGHGDSPLATGIYVDGNGNVLRDSHGRLITSSKQAPSGATKVYNMFGIGAIDSDPINGGAKTAFQNGWTSKEKAIVGGGKWIASRYIHHRDEQDTLYKMRWNPNSPGTHQYATDIGWAAKQVSSIKKLYDQLPNAVKVYDVPKYK